MAAECRGIEVGPHSDEQVALVHVLPLFHWQVDDLAGHLGADLHLHHGLQLAAAGHHLGEVTALGLLGGHRHRLLAVAARAEEGSGRKQREEVAMRHLEGMKTVRRGVLESPERLGAESRSVQYASNLSQIGHRISEIFGTEDPVHRLKSLGWGVPSGL